MNPSSHIGRCTTTFPSLLLAAAVNSLSSLAVEGHVGIERRPNRCERQGVSGIGAESVKHQTQVAPPSVMGSTSRQLDRPGDSPDHESEISDYQPPSDHSWCVGPETDLNWTY